MRDPILLAVELSNGHFMSCRLMYPDRKTLSHLNRWHPRMLKAIFLIELGDLHSLHGPKATAMHRDWGEPWLDHQPRFSSSWNHLISLARSLKTTVIYCHRGSTWSEEKLWPSAKNKKL